MDEDFGEKMDAIMDGIIETLQCSYGDASAVLEAYEMTHNEFDIGALTVGECVKLICA